MGRILVVDDSHFMRTVLAQLVEEEGHQVVTAQDGRPFPSATRRAKSSA